MMWHALFELSTPYQRYREYFSGYYRRYWQTHSDYRLRQNELKRIRYRKNRERELRKKRDYVSGLYQNWFGERPRRIFGTGIALTAEKLAIDTILPKEGFSNILWAQSFKS